MKCESLSKEKDYHVIMDMNGLSSEPSSPGAFSRNTPARGTVARKCREFYLKRLERTNAMQKRWSVCEASLSVTDVHNASSNDDVIENKSDENFHPLRRCQSSLGIAMDSLRKEISSLIAQDNDLFRQLLSLHDTIAELREHQRSFYTSYLDLDEDEDEDEPVENDADDSPSLESLSDNGDLPETSPDSTLSCRSSSLSSDSTNSRDHHVRHHHHHHHHPHKKNTNIVRIHHKLEAIKKRHRGQPRANDEPRPIVFIDRSHDRCFRCHKISPPYRRTGSGTSFYWCNEDLESYDSGIHLQGSHSDSDHEVFV